MADLIITDAALVALKADNELFGKVASALELSIYTLPDLVRRKDARLTQMNVLKLISENTGIAINDLIESANVQPAQSA